jgi:hypothetical protein
VNQNADSFPSDGVVAVKATERVSAPAPEIAMVALVGVDVVE